MIDLVIADDQPLARAGLRMILEGQSDLRVVGEGADCAEARSLVRRLRPAVAILDVRMPRLDGLEATHRIVAAEPRTRILILTTFDLDECAFEALRAGASGFLLKDAPAEDIVHAVRTVARGDAILAPSITRRVVGRYAARPRPDAFRRPTLSLFAAVEVATGAVTNLARERHTAADFLAFLRLLARAGRLGLAAPPQAVHLPLHAHLGEPAHPGRDVVQHPDPPGDPSRQLRQQ